MRLLVVENDDGFRQAWVQLLESFGHSVLWFRSLEGRTAETFHAQGFDLALIDRRAHDDLDHYDKTGETFSVRLCALGTPTVLVTGFLPPNSDLFDLIRTGALTGVAHKSIDMLELAMCVEEFKISHRFPNCVARFSWKGGVDDAFTEEDWRKVRDAGGVPGATSHDYAVLFRSVIPVCARNVELDSIAPGHGGAALFRSRVSSGDGPVVEDVAIKYGDRAIIRSEAIRYDRHVGPLPDGVAAHLRWRKETRLLGAIAYSWVGDSVADGVAFGPVKLDFDNLTWRRRRTALERLFYVSLNPWYTVYRGETAKLDKPIRLLEYYQGAKGFVEPVPFAAEPLPVDLPGTIHLDGGYWDFGPYGRLPNPVEWLANGGGAALTVARNCPCHGDLHVRNIFVLPDDSPRLIDFGDTALGHVFRDFVAIEASIRLTCAGTTDLGALKLASDCASGTETLGEHIDYRSVPSDLGNVRETLITTMLIRRAALDAVGGDVSANSMREYLFALAFRMLRYAAGVADEVSSGETAGQKNSRAWHALYAAAVAIQQVIRHDERLALTAAAVLTPLTA